METVKNDGKKMWQMIDWKGKADVKKETLIHESEITPYFKNIFQSKNTQNHPTIDDIKDVIESNEMEIPHLDCLPQHNELDLALTKVGKGTALEGIPASVCKLLPQCILDNILSLLQKTFVGSYPKAWEKQVLNAIAKNGHTTKNPKLRGVAIAPLFARLYDCILDMRFREWFTPNREQAGFRAGQGCTLQLFSVVLLIYYSKKNKKKTLLSDI